MSELEDRQAAAAAGITGRVASAQLGNEGGASDGANALFEEAGLDSEQQAQHQNAPGSDDGGDYNPFAGEQISEAQAKQLMARGLEVVGSYRGIIKGVKGVMPTEGKMGGVRLSFQAHVGPTVAPEGGWPVGTKLFKKYFEPDEGKIKSEAIDKGDALRLLAALGLPTSGADLYTLLKASQGMSLLWTVASRKHEGRTYFDLTDFKPVAG